MNRTTITDSTTEKMETIDDDERFMLTHAYKDMCLDELERTVIVINPKEAIKVVKGLLPFIARNGGKVK